MAEGAEYQPHWSLVKPRAVAPPVVHRAKWPRTEIDSFILARLEREGLSPTAEKADKATLLRRVSLDLTGLPPTIAAAVCVSR